MFGGFVPREGKFFDLFRDLSEQIVLAANEFKVLISHLPEAEKRSRTIKEIEHRGDEITHTTVALLHQTFITPLDREDIHGLVSRLDDVLDFIDAAAQRVHLYEIKVVPKEGLDLADVVVEAAKKVQQAVSALDNLKNPDEIIKICVEINRLENDADHIYRTAMAKLFKEETDIRQLIKLKELYEILETVTDRCEDVANIIDGIVLEYA